MNYEQHWMDHFSRHAEVARLASKDGTGVGAVLIGDGNKVLLTAFNGPPRGVKDYASRRMRTNGVKYKYVAHAERNLIAFAASEGISTKGKTIYCTHHPCAACAAEIVQAGITCVIVGNYTYRSQGDEQRFAETILREAKVAVEEHTPYVPMQIDFIARGVYGDRLVNDKSDKSIYHHCREVAGWLSRRDESYMPQLAMLSHVFVTTGVPATALAPWLRKHEATLNFVSTFLESGLLEEHYTTDALEIILVDAVCIGDKGRYLDNDSDPAKEPFNYEGQEALIADIYKILGSRKESIFWHTVFLSRIQREQQNWI